MEDTVNQPVVNYRDQLNERLKNRFPDRNFGSPDSPDGTDDIYQSVMEYLDEYESGKNEYEARINEDNMHNQQLVDLFKTNPKAAAFLNTWIATKSPALAFRKIYSQEAFDAMASEEGTELLAKLEADEQAKLAEDAAFAEEKAANLQNSFNELDAWGTERNLSDDEKVNVFMRFYNILADALEGKYSRDLFEMGWKADNYDNDVAAARREGEVAGRNANIKELSRRRNEAAAMPPALSGQGRSVAEAAPTKAPKWGDFLKQN